MLIIHSFYSAGSFYIWGERSFNFENLPDAYSCIAKKPQLLPWCADTSTLNDALKKACVRARRKTVAENSVRAFTMLPTKNGYPIPSSPLLGELPDDNSETVLLTYEISALQIMEEEICALSEIIKKSTEKLFIPGILFADDLKYIATASEYAAVMVTRGTFLPDMETCEDGFTSTWKPLHLAKYQDTHSLYISNIPAVLRSFSLSPEETFIKDSGEIAEAILHSLLDSLVRNSQTIGSRGKKINSKNPHEIWMRSLTWPKSPLSNWNEEMEYLYPQIRDWSDSLRAITGQPWRLFMNVEEPIAEGFPWILSWHLQSTYDTSIIIPASHVWSPDRTEREMFERDNFNPRQYMLQTLGHLSSTVPVVATSLESPYPSDCALSSEELFDFLENHVPSILEQGIQIKFPASWGAISDRPKLALKGVVNDKESLKSGGQINLHDLLDVNWSVSLNDDILTEDEMDLITGLKTPLINIRGKWVLLYRDEVTKVIEGLKKFPSEISRKDALILTFSDTHKNIPISGMTGSKWLKSVKDVLTGVKDIEMLPQPGGFFGKLRPYQIRGFSWMAWLAKLGLGCCLADDMGLGKTVQALALIQLLRNEGEKRPVLLICPTSVIENWRRETEKFLPSTAVLIHHGGKRFKGEKFIKAASENSIVFSSYALLYRDRELLAETEWCGIILDEAQNIKNPDTRQARAAKELTADWHIALTGTPVENHVGDMWSIMDFLLSGLLPGRTSFVRDFLRPIQAGEKSAMEKLRRMTGPFILRRLKTDKNIITDLPKKIETTVFCPLGREQATLYKAVLNSIDSEIIEAEGIKRKGLVLSAITALKQVCNHPALYLKDQSELSGRSGKLARLTEIAEEMLSAGDRALIFTQYVEMGAILKKYLQETFGREVIFLHGGVSREKRDEMVRHFQESNNPPPFFVLSLKAGGTGLNLTRANHVIMFDRWWNPAVEQQAVDRAYRIGQKNNVQVHYFCCKGTIEEKIEILIESKRQIASSVIGAGESWLTELSNEELRELFSLKRDAVEDIRQ